MSRAEIRMALASRVEEVGRWTSAVEDFCRAHGMPQRTAFQFTLCFDELLTNVIVHSLGGAAQRSILVSFGFCGATLQGEIEDDGPAYDPLSAPPPDIDADLDDRPIGGLGVHIVRRMMPEVRYERAGDRNRIRFAQPVDAEGSQ